MADALQIVVLVERCRMDINCDCFFGSAPLANVRKLLGYIFREPWRNEDTIEKLKYYLYCRVENAKTAWHDTSVRYQNEYKSTTFDPFITDQQKKHIEVANKKLLNGVKKAKRLYEREVKIQAYYTDFADKYTQCTE